MKIIFFDTETNGLPKNYKASVLEVDNWPRVIQFAWEVYDTEAGAAVSQAFLIKPEGWQIPTEKFWLDNGFHQKSSLEKGVPIQEVLPQFIEWVNSCDVLVAHNIGFDHPIIGAEMVRAGMKTAKKLHKICTMEATIQLCKIPFGNSKYGNRPGNYKWPKLEELYQFLFKKPMEGAHDACADVRACRECFLELVKRGVIKLPEIAA
jgi:DNA polymerase III subunit epsilon